VYQVYENLKFWGGFLFGDTIGVAVGALVALKLSQVNEFNDRDRFEISRYIRNRRYGL
jgi:hypothetical protein